MSEVKEFGNQMMYKQIMSINMIVWLMEKEYKDKRLKF